MTGSSAAQQHRLFAHVAFFAQRARAALILLVFYGLIAAISCVCILNQRRVGRRAAALRD